MGDHSWGAEGGIMIHDGIVMDFIFARLLFQVLSNNSCGGCISYRKFSSLLSMEFIHWREVLTLYLSPGLLELVVDLDFLWSLVVLRSMHNEPICRRLRHGGFELGVGSLQVLSSFGELVLSLNLSQIGVISDLIHFLYNSVHERIEALHDVQSFFEALNQRNLASDIRDPVRNSFKLFRVVHLNILGQIEQILLHLSNN